MCMPRVFFLTLILMLSLTSAGTVFAQNSVLAFSGAEGFGRYTTGARGYDNPEVYIVTNLSDSGPGSFRDAVSQPGRFVVFAVGGIIRLQTPVAVSPNTTIAGQTAPGDGIVLYGRRVSFSGAINTIARYLRIRLGVNAGAGRNEDASGVANGKDMIFDHMSFSWGQDEVFSINWDGNGFEPDNITIQNSIIGQGLHRHNHSAGGLMETENGKISILKSLYISNKTRNPKVKGVNEFVNNVVYNYGNEGNPYGHTVSGEGYILGGSTSNSAVNIIHNYFISGPATPESETTPFSRGTPTFFLYASGNVFDDNKNGMLDGTPVPRDESGYPGIPPENFMDQPYNYPFSDTTMSAAGAFDWVAAHAGADYPRRDQVDSLMFSDLQSRGTDAWYVYVENDLPLANGGLGEVFGAPARPDSDGDGIPDSWEDAHGLNKNDPSDALAYSVPDPDYFNIEVYINSIMDEPAPDFLRPPSDLAADSVSENTVSLSWKSNDGRESGFILERSGGEGQAYSLVDTLPAGALRYTDEGLEPDTVYLYRIMAFSESDSSVYSDPLSVSTLPVPAPPDQPFNPQPENGWEYTPVSTSLQWEGSQNTGSYALYLGTDPGELEQEAAGLTENVYHISGLEEQTTYYWRVDATNELGTTAGEVWTFITLQNFPEELTGYWSFDEESGSTVTDSSQYAMHGEILHTSQHAWVPGQIGNALDLSQAGNESHVHVPFAGHYFFDNNPFTIALWVKNQPGQAQSYLIHKGTFSHNEETGGTGRWYGIEIKSGQVRFSIDDNITKTELSVAEDTFFTGEWVHLTAVRDTAAGVLRLYRNGEPVAETADRTASGIGETEPLIIANSNNLNTPYAGLLDEMKLFNYRLSDSAIAALAEAPPRLIQAHMPYPENGADNVDRKNIVLSWSGNAPAYSLYFGESPVDMELLATGLSDTSFTLPKLKAGRDYCWQVDATDGVDTVAGPVWTFRTFQEEEDPALYPNPFSQALNIRFTTEKEEPASLSIYDRNGRLVDVLLESVLPAGTHEFQWNARDFNQNPVPTGMYFCILQTPGNRISRIIIYNSRGRR